MRVSVDNKLALQTAFVQITAEFAKTGYLEISTTGKRRSQTQNDCFWPWCREIARVRDDGTDERDVAAEVKLLKAFSIRRADDPEFDELLTKTIDKWWPEKNMWEPAVMLAKEIECTSRLSKEQMSKVLEFMQLHYWQAMQIRLEAK